MFSSFRTLTVAALIAAGFAVLLASIRISNSFSMDEPLQLITSGAEWESIFALWKVLQEDALYNDRLLFPYYAVVYNWLYYFSYAAFADAIMDLFSLADPWLPSIARWFSIIAILTGIVSAFLAFRRLFPDRTTYSLFCLAAAIYLMTGPLVGWWVFTIRSDLWAFTAEIIAATLFLSTYPKNRWRSVLYLVIACYVAWSFKQINVYSIGAAGLLVLVRRDFPVLIGLTLTMLGAWTVTFWVGSDIYRESILFSDFTIVFDPWRGVRNLSNFSVKTLPILCLIAPTLYLAFRDRSVRKKLWQNDSFVFSVSGFMIGCLIAVPASFQTGAAENYFFTWSFYLLLIALTALSVLIQCSDRTPRAVLLGGTAGNVLASLAILATLTGYVGVTDVSYIHRLNTAWAACLADAPRPIVSNQSYLGLPWMTPGNIPFVISFQYDKERLAGKPFEYGGIGGLIAENRINTVALLAGVTPTSYDGASLAAFGAPEKVCEGMYIFTRKESTQGATPR